MILRPFCLLAAIVALAAASLLALAPFVQSQEPKAANPSPTADRGLSSAVANGQANAKPGKRWALLIGINKYQSAPKLRYCGRDVDVLRKALVEHGGYLPEHVQVLSDEVPGSPPPSAGSIYTAFSTFLKLAQPEDTVLFAFCGHGQLDKNGKSYIVPIDGNEALLKQTAIPLEGLHEMLADCPARQKIIILDACHSGGKRGGPEGFDPKDAQPGKGMIELLSCNAVQVSQEDDTLQQGVFSYYLAQAIQGAADVRPDGDENGEISFEEAYKYVHAQVNRYSRGRQSPTVRRGEVEGQLTLAVRAAKTSGATLPDDLLTTRLDAENGRGRISAGLHASSKQWLTTENNIAVGRDMRLALSLLSRGLISEEEFSRLTRVFAPQLDSHVRARENLKSRAIRALLIAVSKYDRAQSDLFDLEGPSNDVRLLEDTLRAHAGDNLKEIGALSDEQATEIAIHTSIERLARDSQPQDVLFISFSGHGADSTFFEKVATPEMKQHLARNALFPYQWQLSKPQNIKLSGAWALASFNKAKLDERLALAQKDKDPAALSFLMDDREDGILSLDYLGQLLKRVGPHVVVLSDTNCDFAAWPKLNDAFAVTSSGQTSLGVAHHVKASRLWIGTPSTVELPQGESGTPFGVLSFLVARALIGQADVATPRFFLPGQTADLPTHSTSRGFGPVSDGAIRSRHPLQAGRPDGYVSFYELGTFLVRNATLTTEKSSSLVKIDVHGEFHPDDVVLTRSTLPVE